jgi:hypothetical protein
MAVEITSISPNTGHVSGGTVITIVGTDFEAAQGSGGVTIGGNVASINSWGDTSIEAIVPAGVIGQQDVIVTNDAPTSDTVAGGFGYVSEDHETPLVTHGIVI